ncbi:MAG: flagellar filament capping protein FliD [Thermodesulfobacteriota bacterium]
MSITFGGLASGMDTASIVDSLIDLERAPITRLQTDKAWLSNRVAAFQEFDGRLQSFLQKAEQLGDLDQYLQKSSSSSSDDFFSTTVTSDALAGVNYGVEVKSLALVQKSHSDNGFSSKTDQIFNTGNLLLTVDGTVHTIEIGSEENTLVGVMQAINDAELGVTASVINDGSDTNPYRLTLTGENTATTFSVDGSALAGTESFGNLTDYQTATAAEIVVDGITITSSSNTIEDAIPGVTLDLNKAEIGTITQVNITKDNSLISANISAFVAGYNEAISFITSQSTMGDTDGGILGGDSGLNHIKGQFQSMLTNYTDNDGPLKALSQLGLETQKNGLLSLNSSTLTEAIDENLDSLVSLLAGEEDGNGGVAASFEEYLKGLTNASTGILAGRKENINTNIERIDARIEQMEKRLVKREETLQKQFMAMEQLVSVMNSQSSFLTQQMTAISNLWNYKK